MMGFIYQYTIYLVPSPPCCTYTLFDFVSDRLQHPSTVALTQFLCGPQVVAGHLHLLLLKRHHGVLQGNIKNKSSN